MLNRRVVDLLPTPYSSSTYVSPTGSNSKEMVHNISETVAIYYLFFPQCSEKNTRMVVLSYKIYILDFKHVLVRLHKPMVNISFVMDVTFPPKYYKSCKMQCQTQHLDVQVRCCIAFTSEVWAADDVTPTLTVLQYKSQNQEGCLQEN